MTEYTIKKAKELRIPTTSTPEMLACERFAFQSTQATFGNLTIVASYTYRASTRGKEGYFWAAYKNEGGIDAPTNLEAVSNEFYEDDGHALAAAFGWAAQGA